MNKLLAGLIFLLFFLFLPAQVSADITPVTGVNSASGTQFIVNVFKPGFAEGDIQSQKIKEGEDFQVSITAYSANQINTSFFKSDLAYGFYLDGQTDAGTAPISCTGRLSRGSNSDLFGTIPLSGPLCSGIKSGPAKLSIYAGGNPLLPIITLPSNKIIDSAPFSIDSTQGGEVATIAHFTDAENNKTVCNSRVTKISLKNPSKNKKYTFYWDGAVTSKAAPDYTPTNDNETHTIPLNGDGLDYTKGNVKVCMLETDNVLNPAQYFPAFSIFACKQPGHYLDFTLKPTPDASCPEAGPTCKVSNISVENNTNRYKVTIQADNFKSGIGLAGGLKDGNGNEFVSVNQTTSATGDVNFNLPEIAAGIYTFSVADPGDATQFCSTQVEVSDKIATGGNPAAKPTFEPVQCVEGECAQSSGEFCDTATNKALPKGQKGDGIFTAIGCIPTDPGRFIAGMMKYVTGFAGGVALLMMVIGAFQMMTSAGNAEGLKKGREQFVSAVIGLLFVIFSVLLMQIIGVDILGLPGFSK